MNLTDKIFYKSERRFDTRLKYCCTEMEDALNLKHIKHNKAPIKGRGFYLVIGNESNTEINHCPYCGHFLANLNYVIC